MAETIFKNARVILADKVINGGLHVKNGQIADVFSGNTDAAGVIDCDNAYLSPGLIELHTDNVERHLNPRPNSIWPVTSAMINHDREIIGAGITTVFNALYVGDTKFGGRAPKHMSEACKAITTLKQSGQFKSDHFLHLRCEVSEGTLMDYFPPLLDNDLSKLVSIMDHTPGQRQFTNLESFKTYYQGKYKMSDDVFARFVDEQMAAQKLYSEPNRRAVVNHAREYGIRLASHDDATIEHVQEAIDDNVSIAEFPTTMEAAKASHQAGLAVLMGGPNIVRGQSHNGNASARDFAAAGCLDIISSDYVPASLLHAVLALANNVENISLPQAVACASKTTAEHVGLNDRGELVQGKRADIVMFNARDEVPIIGQVWCGGERVA